MSRSVSSPSFLGSGDHVHVYLSPHLDDAVLSCGGAIHRQATLGNRVLVVTIFAGEPVLGDRGGQPSHPEMQSGDAVLAGAFSAFALEQHRYWGNPHHPIALRRAEDVAALTLVGASATHLDYLDAVYRAASGTRWLYTDVAALFGAVDPEDPVTPEAVARSLADLLPPPGEVALYAPLGIGHHVDHLIVHDAAKHLISAGHAVAYYEEYPYAEVPGAVEAALDRTGARGWEEEIIPLSPSDVTARVAAIAYYRSQLGILFYGAEAMPSRVWSFAAARGRQCFAERIWWLNDWND